MVLARRVYELDASFHGVDLRIKFLGKVIILILISIGQRLNIILIHSVRWLQVPRLLWGLRSIPIQFVERVLEKSLQVLVVLIHFVKF